MSGGGKILKMLYICLLKHIPMNTFTQKLIAITLILSVGGYVAMADKGFGKKSKPKIVLNISSSFIKNSIGFNMKSGLVYNGSLLNTNTRFGNSMISSSLITFQKGNTTYIIPYKHKIAMPEIRQGYTGMKIIIRK